MLLRKLVVVGLVGLVSFAAQIATAEETVAPNAPVVAIDGVSFADPALDTFADRFSIAFSAEDEGRFAGLSPTPWARRDPDRERSGEMADYEVALVARGAAGFDVAVAQRAGIGFNAQGDLSRERRSSELRLGRGLQRRDEAPSSTPTWYFFAASEDEALVWRPGRRNAFGGSSGGFALEDRVEIGDVQAGITYEAYGVQASLAYVEREISVRTGARTFSQDERFAGITVTLRR